MTLFFTEVVGVFAEGARPRNSPIRNGPTAKQPDSFEVEITNSTRSRLVDTSYGHRTQMEHGQFKART